MPTFSVVVPVYNNADSLRLLIDEVAAVAEGLSGPTELVFVVDGSPDASLAVLLEAAPAAPMAIRVVEHSRNFGAFAAIRTGLIASTGDYVGVMAADLQEPPQLLSEFFATLASGDADVVVGRRERRDDPALATALSRAYWGLYRRWVIPDLPRGGVDVFAVSRRVVDSLASMTEQHTSLVGQLYWVGFRRTEVPYIRQGRVHGRSAWTFAKRWKYMTDSVFAFTDLPMRWLARLGFVGALLTVVAAIVVTTLRLSRRIEVAGYTPLMLAMLFCTFLLIFGLGIVGSYIWRVFENTKGRPHAVVRSQTYFVNDERL